MKLDQIVEPVRFEEGFVGDIDHHAVPCYRTDLMTTIIRWEARMALDLLSPL